MLACIWTFLRGLVNKKFDIPALNYIIIYLYFVLIMMKMAYFTVQPRYEQEPENTKHELQILFGLI